MRFVCLFVLMACTNLTGYSQAEYKDQYLGWIKLIKPTDPVKSTSYDNRFFSAGRLNTCNQFIN